MSWDAPLIFSGAYPDGYELEQIIDQISLLSSPPRARLRQTTLQTIGNGTFTPITFDTEDEDNYDGHSTATNTSRYTCRYAGWYAVTGKVAWSGNATGRRASAWHVNGTVVPGTQIAVAATTASDVEIAAASLDVLLAVDDYIELLGWQDRGGNLDTIVTTSGLHSYMNIRLVGV